MISFPNAKINLGLNILSKREDGYHEIESCFYPIPWHDSLEIVPSKEFSFHSYGLEIPGDSESNLCVKAFDLLRERHGISSVEIYLLKAIPMGAGLGGGSADGAFTLKMLNELFELELSNSTLEGYALELGSDCPFFIENVPAIARGRGEELSKIDVELKGKYLAVHNPGIHISTKEAYAGVTPDSNQKPTSELLQSPIDEWQEVLINGFEKSVFPNHPGIKDLKQSMIQAGATYASMTGSGSTVFGIFDEEPALSDCKILVL